MYKFLKPIISLYLIFLMAFPCFSAVSVGDGSALLSKAQYISDITSLSNQIANLENSIDTKIDTLVSNYLSQNGIWASSDQISDTLTLRSGSLSYATYLVKGQVNIFSNKSLVSSISKTGLCVLKLRSSNSGMIMKKSDSFTLNSYYPDMNGGIYLDIKSKSSKVAYMQIGYANATWHQYTPGSTGYRSEWFLTWPIFTTELTFFVTEGNNLTCDLYTYIATYINTTGSSGTTNTGSLNLYVDSIKVY